MGLENNFMKVNLGKNTRGKVSMFCKVDDELAQRVRDLSYHRGEKTTRTLEKLISDGLRIAEKIEKGIPERPLEVKMKTINRGLKQSKTKKGL